MKVDKKVIDFGVLNRWNGLETNGLGGYASWTVSGANSRCIMDYLVAAMHHP